MAIVTARDAHDTGLRLARFLSTEVEDMAEVSVQILAAPSGTGFSGDTLLFDAAWVAAGEQHRGSFVVRLQPQDYSLYQDHDLDTQWRVIEALDRYTDVPVPTIVAHASGTDNPVGRPFFVMTHVAGRAAADAPPYTVRGWLHDATAAEQRQVYDAGLGVLARIHRTDWEGVGLSFLRGSSVNPVGLAAQMAHDERFLEWALAGRRFPVVEHAAVWLRSNVPPDGELRLSWGDARLGNLMVDEMRPTAALDWEMVTLAAPAADVGWWLVFNQIHTIGIRRPNLPGIPDDDEALELYAAHGGGPLADLHFYEVRAALRAALLLIKYSDALEAAGSLPADVRRHPYTPALTVLEHLLGR